MSPARTLIVLAHPTLERARISPALLDGARRVPGVTLHDLYEAYPDFTIDVPAEQQLLLDHDLIVLQFPLYWYAAPSLMKEWLDTVWLDGFAFGGAGSRLAGKRMTCLVTAGEPQESYAPGGRNRYGVADFLRPFEQTANYCDLVWEEPFVVHRTEARAPGGLERAAAAWAERLRELAGRARDGREAA